MNTKKTVKLVLGVGINDADYQVNRYQTLNGKRKQVWTCPIYRTWLRMLYRCYSKKFHEKRNSYFGCEVSVRWHTFSKFHDWMISQDWEGKQLDKDILVKGNRVYSPETCAFVPAALNMFLVDYAAKRGAYPIGVYWNKWAGKFRAQCKDPFTKKQECIGYFDDQHEAHEAWREYKHKLACKYADMQSDQRIAKALRERFAA